MDGDHSIARCKEVTETVLQAVFAQLHLHKVKLEGIILKPSMVTAGQTASKLEPIGLLQTRLVVQAVSQRPIPRTDARDRCGPKATLGGWVSWIYKTLGATVSSPDAVDQRSTSLPANRHPAPPCPTISSRND